MIDATEHFLAYRECIRHLWNEYYRILDEGESDFVFIERRMLDDLFFSRVKNRDFKAAPDGYYDEVAVTYAVPPNGLSILVLNRDINPGTNTWERAIVDQSLDLRYIEMFDFWDPPNGFRDFRYIRARVVGGQKSTLVGTDVLLDTLVVRMLVRA